MKKESMLQARKEKQNKNLLVEENVLIYIILKLLLFVKKSIQLLSLKI